MNQLPGIVYGVEDIPTTDERKPNVPLPGTPYTHINYQPRNLRIPVQTDLKQIEKELQRLGRKFESTCYELLLDDNTKHYVFPRQVQINPCKYPTSVIFVQLSIGHVM